MGDGAIKKSKDRQEAGATVTECGRERIKHAPDANNEPPVDVLCTVKWWSGWDGKSPF